MKKLIPQSLKNAYHLAQAVLANLRYGFPSRRIKVIGVTGTNGKTTTCQMIVQILEAAGKKVALASTINFKLGEKEWVNKTKYTTLSAASVQSFIRQAVEAGCEYLVLETSSHSLDQFRVWGVDYRTAVITNVTREHLDYHHSIEEYRTAKKRLFRKIETAIVNLDMEKPEEFLDCEAKDKYGYTTSTKENSKSETETKIIRAENIELGSEDTRFEIGSEKFSLHLPGLFNIENALAATCVGLSEGIRLETISEALGKIQGVPGRMEYVPNDKGLRIIIDYAVTPDSLEKLYVLIDGIKGNSSDGHKPKAIAVFGSCGERDRGKRPIMGEIVSRHADLAIVTNEDPYGEDPLRIINEVFAGVLENMKEGENAWKVSDRREAIRKALGLAEAGDIVVITGKGAEETMALGKERIPWNDRKVILEELERI